MTTICRSAQNVRSGTKEANKPSILVDFEKVERKKMNAFVRLKKIFDSELRNTMIK